MLSNECVISLVGGVAVRKDLGDAQDISTLSGNRNKCLTEALYHM